MSKGIVSIILILIIAFSLSFIPLNNDLIDFAFLDDLLEKARRTDDEPLVEEPDSFEYSLSFMNDTQVYENPDMVEILLWTDDLSHIFDLSFSLEVLQDDARVKRVNDESVQISSENLSTETQQQIRMTIDLSKRNLEIPTGAYTFKITSNDENLSASPLVGTLNYIDEYDYVGASNVIPSNEMALTLYFADHGMMYLIPVTRLIPTGEGLIRSTINNLYEGPSDASGLYQGDIAPWSPSAYLHDDILDLHYNSSALDPYNQGSTSAYFAINSIVNTMTAIPYIGSVQFYVNDRIPTGGEYFHGSVLDEPQKPLGWPSPYLGHVSSTGKVFLVPVEVYDLQVEDVFNSLKANPTDPDDPLGYLKSRNTIACPLPMAAEFNTLEVSDGIVHLDLEGASLSAYGAMDSNYQMMIDALIYSYTSFDEINALKLTINGESPSDYHGVDLSTPLEPKTYINMEP
jgi:spore germination protein GerM